MQTSLLCVLGGAFALAMSILPVFWF